MYLSLNTMPCLTKMNEYEVNKGYFNELLI